MKLFDKDGDVKISKEEFVSALKELAKEHNYEPSEADIKMAKSKTAPTPRSTSKKDDKPGQDNAPGHPKNAVRTSTTPLCGAIRPPRQTSKLATQKQTNKLTIKQTNYKLTTKLAN